MFVTVLMEGGLREAARWGITGQTPEDGDRAAHILELVAEYRERYANPYIAGAGVGLVLLASFVFAGRGLGASGAFAWAVARVAPVSGYFSRYLSADLWLVVEILGVILGLGRALGETMAVTMVIGNTPQIAASLFKPGYTLASVIANEFTEATTDMYLQALFEIGLVLFGVTILVNLLAQLLLKTISAGVTPDRVQ